MFREGREIIKISGLGFKEGGAVNRREMSALEGGKISIRRTRRS